MVTHPMESLTAELKKGFLPIALLFLMVVVFRVAWVTEDAFISFRAIDNLLHGRGFVYNMGERVQVFTDPLYCLILAVFAFFTRGEYFYTCIGISMALTFITAWILGYKIARNPIVGAFSVLILSMSVAFTEFSTSGLENPVTHVLLALFFVAYLTRANENPFHLALIAGLAATNRLDSLLFFIPALVHVFLKQASFKTFRQMGAGFIPFFLWELFSLIYYGFLVPNTAFAKLNLGIDGYKMMEQGFVYLFACFTHDPVTTVMVGLIPLTAWLATRMESNLKIYLILGGIVLKLVYVVLVGGDYMLGRFFTDISLASLMVFAFVAQALSWKGSIHFMLFIICLGLAVSVQHSPFISDLSYGSKEVNKFEWLVESIVDERSFYYGQTGLANRGRYEKVRNSQVNEAIKLSMVKELGASGVSVMGNAGMLGLYSDPELHLIDIHGLCDPLMARLPLTSDYYWRTGHYNRNVPEGYEQSIKTGKNQIRDPDLAQYYDKLKTIVSGDIFSAERFETILLMNLGKYNDLIDRYLDHSPDVTYRHLKFRNGKYHYPFNRLTAPIQPGTDVFDHRVLKFDEHFASVVLDFDSACHIRNWTTSFSSESLNAIRFFKGDDYLGTSLPFAQSNDPKGMQAYSLLVPETAWIKGYDHMEIVPFSNERKTANAFWAAAKDTILIPFHLMPKNTNATTELGGVKVQPADLFGIYGPFITIPAGRYQVLMEFEREPGTGYSITSNIYKPDHFEVVHNFRHENPAPGLIVTDLEIKNPCPSIEFRYIYLSEKPVPILIKNIQLVLK